MRDTWPVGSCRRPSSRTALGTLRSVLETLSLRRCTVSRFEKCRTPWVVQEISVNMCKLNVRIESMDVQHFAMVSGRVVMPEQDRPSSERDSPA